MKLGGSTISSRELRLIHSFVHSETMPETEAATVSETSPETATWTRYLPEWGGIRSNIQNSPFRWCVRESFMWGIASGK